MPSKSNKRPIINDIPVQELMKIKDTTPEVRLKVRRTTSSGQWMSVVPRAIKPITDMMDGKLEEWLQSYSGGGQYIIEVWDPLTEEPACDRFRIVLPGAPKDPKLNASDEGPPAQNGNSVVRRWGVEIPKEAYHSPGIATPQMIGQGQISRPPLEGLPSWAKRYPASQQWEMYYDRQRADGKLPVGASVHSDQLAVGYAKTFQEREADARAINAQLTEKLTALNDKHNTELSRLRDEMARIREEAARKESQSQVDALRAEITALRETPKQTVDWGAVLAGAAPIIAAYLGSTKDKEIKSLEVQSAQQAAMMQVVTAPKGNNIGELLTAAAPIISAMLANQSPQAKAEALATNQEINMMMIKMIADLQAGMAPQEDTWSRVIGMLGGMMQNAGSMQGLPQGAAPALGSGAPAQQATDPTWERMANSDPAAAQKTQLVMQHMPTDLGFHTHEWKLLIFNIHAKTAPSDLVPMLIQHLHHCEGFGLLPQPFENVWTDPRGSLGAVLAALPINADDPAYCEAVLEHFEQTVKGAISSHNEKRRDASQNPPIDITPPAPIEVERMGSEIEMPSDNADGAAPQVAADA